MMSSYVCRQCRTRIIQRFASSRNPQWQPKATFLSIRKERTQPDNAQDSSHNETLVRESEGASSNPRIRRVGRNQNDGAIHTEIPDRSAQAGRYSRYAQDLESEDPRQQQQVLDNAEDNISPEKPRDSIGDANRRLDQSSDNVRIVRSLNAGRLDKAWSHFNEVYTTKDCKAIREPSFQDANLWTGGNIFKRLLDATVIKFCKDGAVPATPSEILFRYHQLDLFKFAHLGFEDMAVELSNSSKKTIANAWRDTIRILTDEVLLRMSGASSRASVSEGILTELLSVWRLLFQIHGSRSLPLESIDTEWSSIPDASDIKLSLSDPSMPTDISKRLEMYHPKLAGNATLGYCAITIFNLFREKSQHAITNSDSFREHHARFLSLLAHVLPGANVQRVLRHTDQSVSFKKLPAQFQKSLIDEIYAAPSVAMALVGSKAGTASQSSGPERAASQEEFLLKRIERAIVEQAHKERLERLWQEVVRTYTTKDSETHIPPTLYNAFLTGYLALFAADRSVEVWNHMVAHGVKPNVLTWTAMLTGCEKARDLNGLNAMWQRMIRFGTQPDAHAWTTRIHGLISLRQINAGLGAMDDMGRQWLAAEQLSRNSPADKGVKKTGLTRATANNLPKPTVEVVNGAISALVNIPAKSFSFERKAEQVRKILQWARDFGIKPDARTYNILIKLYMSGKDTAAVFNLLRHMEKEGIEADIATYTILIRASFDSENFSNLSQDEQTSRIVNLFTDLEAGGLKLNAYVYASTIDRLLKQYSNFPAVRAVIDHMLSRNLIPNPHIYTSLMTHYFQSSPPNIDAADSLWHQIMSVPGTPTDKVLFDRVIEGYAGAGEVGKMMAVLTRMSKHGKLPGWTALTAVVRALVERGEWERARSVVMDVRNGEGVAKGGITGGMLGQNEFLHLVRELGLLAEGESMDEMQMRKPRLEMGPSPPSPRRVQNIGSVLQESSNEEIKVDEQMVGEAWRNGNIGDVNVDEGTRAEVLPEPEAGERGMKDIFEANVQPEEHQPQENWRTENNGSVGGIPL